MARWAYSNHLEVPTAAAAQSYLDSAAPQARTIRRTFQPHRNRRPFINDPELNEPRSQQDITVNTRAFWLMRI
ncbi:hypothetical protein GA0115240_11776 [Streptomyces sp. DvalAA-14]|nr:hypothetical protein GA0115240_11776 [Streptomyces sp. DvalAA-14]